MSDKGGGKKGDKKERGKSAKKGGGKKTPEPPSAKKESKLRKRGEEDPDSKYIGLHVFIIHCISIPKCLIPVKVSVPFVQTLCIEKDSYMDTI